MAKEKNFLTLVAIIGGIIIATSILAIIEPLSKKCYNNKVNKILKNARQKFFGVNNGQTKV